MAVDTHPRHVDPGALRAEARSATFAGTTAGHCPGFAQANLVVLPRSRRSTSWSSLSASKALPSARGARSRLPEPRLTAWGADVRTDLPAYRVYRDGSLVGEVGDLIHEWRDDAVAVLIGCSFTFEEALVAAGVPVRHLEDGVTVPMYRTRVACVPAGRFAGPLVVTMWPIPAGLVARAVEVTARYPDVHGAPVHVGDPEAVGIAVPALAFFTAWALLYAVIWATEPTACAVATSPWPQSSQARCLTPSA